jgi:hypothetical protein
MTELINSGLDKKGSGHYTFLTVAPRHLFNGTRGGKQIEQFSKKTLAKEEF